MNDTPVACQIREPTRRETGAPISRRRQPPPTHCGASRRNGRDLIIATRPAHQPLPSLLSAAAAQAVQAIPEPTTTSPAEPIPRSQHRQICTYPPRAKGSLNRRFEWFSLVTFFLQKKKVTRAGARNAPSRARRQCPPNTTAASAATYPLRCFAPQWARFDNRQNRPAHPVLLSHCVSGSGASGTSDP